MTPGSYQDDALFEEAFQLFGRLVARSDPGRFDTWAELGLTITQLRVLFHLRAHDGLSAGALAERIDVTPSTLTRIMDRLVQASLIRREPDPEDRRLVRHGLTERGLLAIEQMERAFRSRMSSIYAHLSRKQLERIVCALRDLTSASDVVDAGEGARIPA